MKICCAVLNCVQKLGRTFSRSSQTGGKEVHDEAILNGDLPLSVFALGILGSGIWLSYGKRLWQSASSMASFQQADSACGFANTAMVLAEQKFIPRVWAAIIRVLSVAAAWWRFEQGACWAQQRLRLRRPFIKAITGCPINLEGAEAACAHLSPIGNNRQSGSGSMEQ